MRNRSVVLKTVCACLALILCAAPILPVTALADAGPQPQTIDLDLFCRQNCVSSFLSLRGKVTLYETREYSGWKCDVTTAYRNLEDGTAWWSLAEYTADEYLNRSQTVFIPGRVPQRTDLLEETDGHRTLRIYSPHSAELFAEYYLVYGYETVLSGYGKLYLGSGTSDGQTDTWEIFAALSEPYYAYGTYEVSRRTGWIERASVICYDSGTEEETWTLRTETEADDGPLETPGYFAEETGTVRVTLCIGHEDNSEEVLSYLVVPGTEIIYTDYEEFTAYRDAEKTDRVEEQEYLSVSFGSIYEDAVFYISAI